MKNEILLKKMMAYYNNENLQLPSGIEFIQKNDACYRMILSAKKVQEKNMQVVDNAFEGWAIAVYIAMEKNVKIILDVSGEFNYDGYEKEGHLGRFLYRALKFNEQYDWFDLSDYLIQETAKFNLFLNDSLLTNNIANGEAGTKDDHNKENVVEAKLAESGELKKLIGNDLNIGNNNVYRQLPVGLFKDKVSKATMIFTGGKSAIDLWTWNEEDFYVVELKTLNPMIGIVSEVFFYSNYMRDLLLENGMFELNKNTKKKAKDDRGYSDILDIYQGLKCIKGVMLADGYHPLVNREVIKVLNAGTFSEIEYSMQSYKYELKITEA